MPAARLTERARRLLERPGAWVDETPTGYPLRLGGDRRGRVVLMLDERAFHAVVERPGLRRRNGGGWHPRAIASDRTAAAAGQPGRINGQRAITEDDGAVVMKAVNLGESPIAWLARRKDHAGRPWLSPTEIAAGEKLRMDAEAALRGASLTMRWDGMPRAQSGTGPSHLGPTDRAINASQRVEAALQAAGPRLRAMLDQVCVRGTALQVAEQELALRRRQGKTVLKQGLQALAVHYGLGS